MAERGVTHGMRYQARALAPLPAERDTSRWMAGTTALREDNEVRPMDICTHRAVHLQIDEPKAARASWCQNSV